jgi:GPH family glycoside/pentoside/hexuronide:cation symporter
MNDMTTSTPASSANRLSFPRKLGYGLGSSAANFVWQMVSFYLVFFYTDVFGIPAAAAGTILLAARIFDALNDPVMGHIADQTRTRWGRFRPYLLLGAVPFAVIFVLAFSTPTLSPNGKIAYAAITYLLLGVAYTAMTVPHSALMASVTQDTNERSSLASITMIAIYSTILVVAAATMPLVNSFSSQQTGFTATACIYGVVAVGLYMICFKSTRELQSSHLKRHRFREELKLVAQNKPLIMLLITVCITQAANDMRTTAAIFFLKYNIGNEPFYPLFMAIMILSMIGGASLTPTLDRRLGSKRNLYVIGTLIVIPANAVVLLTPYENLPAIVAALAVSSVGVGITYVMVRSMFADMVEYGEWKTGIRGEGIILSTYGVANKLGYAAGGSLAAFLLASAGYAPNVAQSHEVQTLILYMVALFPIIAGILAIGVMHFYGVDARCYNRILKEISERKQGETE